MVLPSGGTLIFASERDVIIISSVIQRCLALTNTSESCIISTKATERFVQKGLYSQSKQDTLVYLGGSVQRSVITAEAIVLHYCFADLLLLRLKLPVYIAPLIPLPLLLMQISHGHSRSRSSPCQYLQYASNISLRSVFKL